MKKNKKLARALEDLDQAFGNLEVKPLADANLKRTTGGTNTTQVQITCNSKCGHTNYWECGGGGASSSPSLCWAIC